MSLGGVTTRWLKWDGVMTYQSDDINYLARWEGKESQHQQCSSGNNPNPWWYLVEDNGCHKIKVVVLLQGHPLSYHKNKLSKQEANELPPVERPKHLTNYMIKLDQ